MIDRFKLLFGPYKAPPLRFGDVVQCEARGEVVVVGLSNGRIPWPVGRRKGTSARGPVLFADLARAVRHESNQAVCHWWGVTPQTVTKWRKALDIGATTEGTSRLRREIAETVPAIVAGLSKAQEQARDQDRDSIRREKIAAARAGKPRPRSIIQAMRKGRTGKPHDAAARQRMSESQRRRGTRPPAAGPAWTPEEDGLLRELPAIEVARRTGRTLGAVYKRRSSLGVPDARRE
jgi:hypothetical protein